MRKSVVKLGQTLAPPMTSCLVNTYFTFVGKITYSKFDVYYLPPPPKSNLNILIEFK